MALLIISWSLRLYSLYWGYKGYPWYTPLIVAPILIAIVTFPLKPWGKEFYNNFLEYLKAGPFISIMLIITCIVPYLIGVGINHLMH